MSVIWHKVWRDLADNRGRTLLAVLSIAVGVFALGLIYGAYDTISSALEGSHWAAVPVDVTFWAWPVDPSVEDAVTRLPGVADTERQVDSYSLWKLEGETNWRDANLYGRVDYAAQRMGVIDLVDGQWPGKRTLAVERQTSRYLHIPLGTSIIVQVDGREREVLVTGIVHDYALPSPQFGNSAAFYATPDTIAWLNGDGFNRVDVRLNSPTIENAVAVSEQARGRLERMGSSFGGNWIREPGEHWFQQSVDTMLAILTSLGAASIGMSAFLIVNTMNAVIAQQVWQIGVMKALGATSGRVARTYLTITLIYGLLALLIAVPLGAVGAHLLANWILDYHANILPGAFRVTPAALAIQFAVGLIVPSLAGLVPVLRGARISPHQAMRTYGLGGRFGRSGFDRLLGKIRRLPRPLALSLRNTFRRKARVLLTLSALGLGGAMFMMVMSVTQSFRSTVDALINEYGDDIRIGLDRPHRIGRLVEVAKGVQGVADVEIWASYGTRLKLVKGDERYMGLRGMPADSAFLQARIVSGRELLPSDDHAILLNYRIASEEGIAVGDEVRFEIREEETTWQVVGLVLVSNTYDSFVPFSTLSREMGTANRGTRVHVATEEHDLATQRQVVGELRDAFTAARIEPTWSWSTAEMREEQWDGFSTIFYLLLAMAILSAVVGGVGMMGTMSINVVERRREIGVMRATGASAGTVGGIFVGEGVLLGLLSWALAVPLSYPGGRALGNLIGSKMMNFPLNHAFSIGGVLLWLFVAVAIAAAASLWPALQATRLSVRQTLAYE